jgi:hypothetical protein
MSARRLLLGKIFISHSSLDKRSVRRLVKRLESEGFDTWLDEHEIVAGDPLARRIAEGVASSKIVIVVVSTNSVKSKWLKYELNIATDRMVISKARRMTDVGQWPALHINLSTDGVTTDREGSLSLWRALKDSHGNASKEETKPIADVTSRPASFANMVPTGDRDRTGTDYESEFEFFVDFGTAIRIFKREPDRVRNWFRFLTGAANHYVSHRKERAHSEHVFYFRAVPHSYRLVVANSNGSHRIKRHSEKFIAHRFHHDVGGR